MAIRSRKSFSSKLTFLALASLPFLEATADPSGSVSPLAQRELERRGLAVQEAQELLLKGDEAYEAGKFADAVAAYAGARDLLPLTPMTAELRAAATDRFAQASIENGKELSRKGDVLGAKALMDRVLDSAVAPGHAEAKIFRNQLDDPIRTNPALTKEHAADVDKVRRQLYIAEGAFQLGKFDQSEAGYNAVLKIDPYNTAARRGMERVAAAKSNYARTAYDHTRAEMLGMVDASWELPLAPELVEPDFAGMAGRMLEQDMIPISNKLKRIVIPSIRLEQATLVDAIDLLRLRAAENDPFETDPARRGVNIALNLGDPEISPAKEILETTFDLQLSNVPVEQVLKYLTEITRTVYRAEDYAVSIRPAGAMTDEMMSRNYRVPPDFLSRISGGATEENNAANDPFNQSAPSGLLARRLTAQEAFSQQGIPFPEGSSATFNPVSNMLRVVNTPLNHDMIEQVIALTSQSEPVSVAVRVTMLKIQQTNLEELGFDWMLDGFGFGGASWIPGADKLNLTGGTTGSGNAITDIVPPLPAGVSNPITAGNRSGDHAFPVPSIDSLISSSGNRGAQTRNRAPGVFGVNGVVGTATIQSLMRGLDQKKGVDMMAQPSVTTRSGQAASIRLIREFIYPTEYDPPELPNQIGGGDVFVVGGDVFGPPAPDVVPVTPAMPTAFQMREVGVFLDVLPVADENRQFVDVTLNPSMVDLDGFVNYGSPINTTAQGPLGPVIQEQTPNSILMPVFSVMRTSSNLIVADGATIVIGGLMKDEVQIVDDKTPILGDIPIVGRLFQSRARQNSSTAILFLVNVELLDPTGRPYRDR